mmetsp:Transcript_21011/g.67091  ORF Transcript_21011/g.67091 Transcript_21011/m.67091 type:complete len:407 (-) Transcript_21011:83-1303(-)
MRQRCADTRTGLAKMRRSPRAVGVRRLEGASRSIVRHRDPCPGSRNYMCDLYLLLCALRAPALARRLTAVSDTTALKTCSLTPMTRDPRATHAAARLRRLGGDEVVVRKECIEGGRVHRPLLRRHQLPGSLLVARLRLCERVDDVAAVGVAAVEEGVNERGALLLLPLRRRRAARLPLPLPLLEPRNVVWVLADAVHRALEAAARGAVDAGGEGAAPVRRLCLHLLRSAAPLWPQDNPIAVPLLFEDLQVLIVDVVDAVDGTALDRLRDHLRVVSALHKGARPPSLLLHKEGVSRHAGAIGAADAVNLVHIHESKLHQVAVLVAMHFEVRGDGLVVLSSVRRLLGAAKERAHQPRVGLGVLSAHHLHAPRAPPPRPPPSEAASAAKPGPRSAAGHRRDTAQEQREQ